MVMMPATKKGTWPRPSKELIELLATHAAPFKAEERKMFGCPCYFVHGQMFAGVFADSLFARFSPSDRDHLDEKGLASPFEPVKGRQMKEYRALGREIWEDPDELDGWLSRSYTYASSLPPK
jgi:TfoX/Sxy family transcriptional regulator of competence genes